MNLHAPSASHRARNEHRERRALHALGMTLVELLVGLAITTLMTVAGWRAIESLQTARDVTQRDVAQWQSLDSLFESIEADLRRADLSRFNGNAAGFSFRLNALVATEPATDARYRLASESGRANVVRDASDGSLAFGGLSAARFEYHVRDLRTGAPIKTDATDRYPRAIEVVVAIVGNEGAAAREVRRVLVLQ